MALHRRIILIGCGGSGKSTFARKLGEATGLPVVHLDQLYWKPGWQHLSKDEFDEVLAAELTKPEWIMDGNFDRTIPRRLEFCDAVIFLDLPRLVCISGVIRRVISSYGRTRPDMGEGCPERFDLSFLKWVWNFNKEKREKYLSLLNSSGKTVYRIRSRRELPALIETIAGNH
ncbi:MAG: topology modulation protein [Clostridia bacterium]|nr:topology modulation protein [Clostridia bacterium]